ncbi:type II toxin-antitoxin system VapC family toxin [Marinicellulosiphila megalodicopiae]|uniref:type II toxin-antitoxin system VapC family toxin n=1 Tax=Marinicellulosiphila megalodicopiae TaxID=2724896 RepID=UPI003BB1B35B
MAKTVYMLDTCICSFIMREQPLEVLQKLQNKVMQQHRIVISAVTYAEMCYGIVGKKASPKHKQLVVEFIKRVDEILPWDKLAVESSALVKKQLSDAGTPIGNNDTGIAGHAISQNCILVTNNLREFNRVEGLNVEDWVH